MPREVARLPWAVQLLLPHRAVGRRLSALLPGLAFGRSKWRNASRPAPLGAPVRTHRARGAAFRPAPTGRFTTSTPYMNAKTWMAWGFGSSSPVSGGLMLYAWLVTRPDFQRLADRGGRWHHRIDEWLTVAWSSTGAIRAAAA